MYCILRPPWYFKSDNRCPLKVMACPLKVMTHPLKVMAHPLKVTAHTLKVMAGPLNVTACPLNVIVSPLKVTTSWVHLLSHLKYQGGLKIEYITVHYKVMGHFLRTKYLYFWNQCKKCYKMSQKVFFSAGDFNICIHNIYTVLINTLFILVLNN